MRRFLLNMLSNCFFLFFGGRESGFKLVLNEKNTVSLFGEYGCSEDCSLAQGERLGVNVHFQKDEMLTGKTSSVLPPVVVEYHLPRVLHQKVLSEVVRHPRLLRHGAVLLRACSWC